MVGGSNFSTRTASWSAQGDTLGSAASIWLFYTVEWTTTPADSVAYRDVMRLDKIPTGNTPPEDINCRPVGVLVMEGDAGHDEKLLAVPSSHVSGRYHHVDER